MIATSTKNLSVFELAFGDGEHRFAHICKSSEKLTPIFNIAYYSHTLKCGISILECICDTLKVYHAAANKLMNLRCLLLLDVPEFEVSKSFLFTHITNFEDLSCS